MSKMIRMITTDGSVMVCGIDSKTIVAKAEELHKTSAVITAAIGRLLTAASMMGAMLKGEKDSLTLRINGKGPSGSIVCVSDSDGNVRGFVEKAVVELPLNEKGKLDVGGAIGRDGLLTVIKDLNLKEPYIAQIPIVSGEIAEDITSYYATSEQIPTICGLGVLVNPDLTVNCAGGFIVQLLPSADISTIEKLEENIEKMQTITQMLSSGLNIEDICYKVLSGFDCEVLDSFAPEYKCTCSRKRVEKVILSLPKEEIDDALNKDGKIELVCHFCNKKYNFGKDDIKKII